MHHELKEHLKAIKGVMLLIVDDENKTEFISNLKEKDLFLKHLRSSPCIQVKESKELEDLHFHLFTNYSSYALIYQQGDDLSSHIMMDPEELMMKIDHFKNS